MTQYPNLNVRSNYSFLASAIKLDDYLTFAKKNNLSSLALVDTNVMYGVYEFYELCKKNHIKPIIGLNCWLKVEGKLLEVNLIAGNYSSYKSLIILSSSLNIYNKEQFLTIEDLDKCNKELIVIFVNPEKNLSIISNYFSELKTKGWLNLYFGIASTSFNLLTQLEKITNNIIPHNLVQYLEAEEVGVFSVIQAIKTQQTIDGSNITKEGANYYYLSEEMNKFFAKSLLNNLQQLVDGIDLIIPKIHQKDKIKTLPLFPCPDKINNQNYLKNLCKEGLKKRFATNSIAKIYLDRLLFELDIINKMNFNDYFLIVHDYVQFARNQKIVVGPGRGSVAGSLVAYVLEITDVDPIKYDLIFERFLNPERTSLPDIDIDIQDERREEVFSYLVGKYGQDNVAHIITFQTMASKTALRDIGRVFNFNLQEINEISKLVPLQFNFDLSKAVASSTKLKVYETKYPLLFAYAKKLIGFPRQTSTHAAGIVLTKEPIKTIVPVQKNSVGIYLTQYSMVELETNGLIKMDILGLRNLTILKNILDLIANTYKKRIDLEKLPLNNAKTFRMLQAGDTTGIFQLESPGMRRILQSLKSSNLEDIIATTSLFRPGPQEHVKSYINRKLGNEKVTYTHSDLMPILKSSYGIMIYQEQILLVLQKIAGFSLAKADLIRRAIGKKDFTEMKAQQKVFTDSALSRGYDSKVVATIWNDIYAFAGYGFNKSHAVAYSLIGYQLAYLKANYPLAFMASLLTSSIGNDTKMFQYLFECQKYHISILPPSINYSDTTFLIDQQKQGIRYSLQAIKQMSYLSCQNLLVERTKGLFKDYYQFCARAIRVGLTQKNIEYLIFSGSLDEIHSNRVALLKNLDNAMRYASVVQVKNKDKQIVDLDFNLSAPVFQDYEDDFITNGENEFLALGLYLKYNPEQEWTRQLDTKKEAIEWTKIKNLVGKSVKIIGQINTVKTFKTKTDKLLCFISIKNNNAKIDVTVFPKQYQDYQDICQVGKVIFFVGKVTMYNDTLKLNLESIINYC